MLGEQEPDHELPLYPPYLLVRKVPTGTGLTVRTGRETEGRPEGAGLTSRPGLRREGVTELNEDTSSEVNRVCLSSFPLTLHSARYAVYVNGEGRIVNGRIERE